jgi:hypothetical protein
VNEQGPTPPGWYDGTGWSEVTRPPVAPASPPPPGRRHRGALVAIVTAAVLLVGGGATALVLLLGSDDEGGEEARDDPTTQPTDQPTGRPTEEPTGQSTDTSDPVPGDPALAVQRYVDAALSGDCDTAESYVTEELLRREGGCERGNLGNLDRVRARVGRASIEPGEASVPVTLFVQGGTQADDEVTYDVRLLVLGDEWKIHDVRRAGHMR